MNELDELLASFRAEHEFDSTKLRAALETGIRLIESLGDRLAP
jgi:hypothetical protein